MLDRRDFLARATAAAASLPLARGAVALAAPAPPVPLPGAARIRADIQRMVDLGPRSTGTTGHDAFVDWLEEELAAAGCVMYPRDEFELTIWEADKYGLEIVQGAAAGNIPVSAYYPRSQETPAAGVTGPLVYAGVAPLPSLSIDRAGLEAALGRYPLELTSWAQGLLGLPGLRPGAILLVDVPMPLPATLAAFVALATFLHWPGHDLGDWLSSDIKRPWLARGITGVPLAPFEALGAAGVVFILDASAEALRGAYVPFENGFEPLPALFVDRDTGNALRKAAAGAPRTRLTLTATRRKGTAPAIMGYLPAENEDEAIFLNSHTDGEGFVEENGGVAMVGLARHFGSLPASRRLKRTLVFSLWPGHMASGMPQLSGVLNRHEDIVRSSVAGLTIEHLGCSEWVDSPDRGYHATGDPDWWAAWTTQGPVFELARDATIAVDVPRTMLLRPPVQFGVGLGLQLAGIPQVGCIAGPYYLLNDAPGSDVDKLDAALAAKQVAWLAEIMRRMDALPAAVLASGDPTLVPKTAGRRAKFPAPPAVALRVSLRTPLRGAVTLNRSGLVRLHAVLEHGRRRTPIGDALLRVPTAGRTSFTLKPTKRGRAALRAVEGGRIVVTARFRERRVTYTSRARRRRPK